MLSWVVTLNNISRWTTSSEVLHVPGMIWPWLFDLQFRLKIVGASWAWMSNRVFSLVQPSARGANQQVDKCEPVGCNYVVVPVHIRSQPARQLVSMR